MVTHFVLFYYPSPRKFIVEPFTEIGGWGSPTAHDVQFRFASGCSYQWFTARQSLSVKKWARDSGETCHRKSSKVFPQLSTQVPDRCREKGRRVSWQG